MQPTADDRTHQPTARGQPFLRAAVRAVVVGIVSRDLAQGRARILIEQATILTAHQMKGARHVHEVIRPAALLVIADAAAQGAGNRLPNQLAFGNRRYLLGHLAYSPKVRSSIRRCSNRSTSTRRAASTNIVRSG